MPLIDITNPDIIKFLVESYNKTNLLTLRWNQLHKAQLVQAATLAREEKGYREADVAEAAMKSGLAAIARDHTSAAVNRIRLPRKDSKAVLGISALRKGHTIVDIALGDPKDDPLLNRPDTDLQKDPKMRPVDPEQKAILYKDMPFFGREVYIKNRNHIIPEKKYYFPETSGWEYGWRLKDSPFGKSQARCGRVWRLKRDVSSRSGPQPDPPHYMIPDQQGMTMCSI